MSSAALTVAGFGDIRRSKYVQHSQGTATSPVERVMVVSGRTRFEARSTVVALLELALGDVADFAPQARS